MDIELRYDETAFAFNVRPRPASADCSVLVNALELMVDRRTNRVLFVEGYCPHFGWKASALAVPPFENRSISVTGVDWRPGVAVPVNANSPWATSVDLKTGWLRIGDEEIAGDAAQFAPGCLAVVADGRLQALWLRPRELSPGVLGRVRT